MARKILIVDDTFSVRSLLSVTLGQMGFEVIQGENVDDGLAKLQQNQDVELIFSDYNMPGKNGIEFVKSVKAMSDFKSIPVVMLTTESDASKKAEGKQAGAMAWIVKPFKVETVQSVVKKILG